MPFDLGEGGGDILENIELVDLVEISRNLYENSERPV